MDKIKAEEFKEVCKPVIKWLNENYHPHVTAIVTPGGAELSEGLTAFQTDEFIPD